MVTARRPIFYDDSSVLYVNIHCKDKYTYYSGFEEEVGRTAARATASIYTGRQFVGGWVS